MPEQFPDSIDLQIHYGPHLVSADFDFLDDAVRSNDTQIYVPEMNGYTAQDVAGFNKVANGDSKIYREAMGRMNPEGIQAAQLKALFASKKRVELLDMPAEQIYANPFQLALLTFQQQHAANPTSSYQEISMRFLESLYMEAHLSRKRDEVIAHNIIHELPKRIRTNPRLSKLGSVGVFMTLGDMHDGVTARLEAAGVPVTTNEITTHKTAGEKAGMTLVAGDKITQSQIDESLASGRLIQHLRDKTSTNELRRVVNEMTQGFEQSDTEEVLRVHSMGSRAVHEYVRAQIKNRNISVSDGFEYVTPADMVPYTPAFVTTTIGGRTMTVASVF